MTARFLTLLGMFTVPSFLAALSADRACPSGAQLFRNATLAGYALECREPGGLLQGPFVTYLNNNQKASEGSYRSGELDGPFHSWYADGRPREQGAFRSGKKDGLWITWFSNGQKSSEGTYRDGDEYGNWKTWFATGTLKEAGEYRGRMVFDAARNIRIPRREGLWTFWYENGDKKRETVFREGVESAKQ